MKLVVFTRHPSEPQALGRTPGWRLAFEYFVNALRDLGHDVDVVRFGPTWLVSALPRVIERIRRRVKSNAAFAWVTIAEAAIVRAGFRLQLRSRRVRAADFGIFFENPCYVPPPQPAGTYALVWDAATLSNVGTPYLPEPPPRLVCYFGRAERATLAACSFVSMPVRYAVTEARRVHGDVTQWHVAAWGPNMSAAEAETAVSTPLVVSADKTPCRLIFVSNSWWRKGGPIAIKITELLREHGIDAHLTLIGHHPRVPLPTGVESVGPLLTGDPDQRARFLCLLRQASFNLLPTEYEIAPHPVFECGLFGVPTVSTPIGGLPEMIADGVSGLLCPCDPEAMAAAIAAVWRDPPRYAAMRAAARQKASSATWRACAEAIVRRLRDRQGRSGSRRWWATARLGLVSLT